LPQNPQYAHRNLRNLNLPYVTNVSPIDTEAKFVSGSTDLLTSINGFCERRPGFATVVGSNTFNDIQRVFTWDRTDGTFYIVVCDMTSVSVPQVWSLQSGIANAFTLLYSDTTGFGLPFDFVVSNNTLYFSNGHVSKKWDPLNGVSNWGIAVGSVASSVNAFVGTGADGGGPNPWLNPTRFQGAPDALYTTVALTAAAHGNISSNNLNGTNYGFALAATDVVVGIQVDITGFIDFAGFGTEALLLQFGGGAIGTQKPIGFSTSATTITLGGPSDLWGTTITASMVNSASFGVLVGAGVGNGSGSPVTRNFSVDAAKITVYKLGGPAIAVSGAAGTFTATAGYQYVFCYGNSNTGHISSPSPVSANTGVFTLKANVAVTLTASTDSQVNQIRLFRTTDGGGGIYYELPTSPYPNSTGAVNDAAADTALNVLSIAPTSTFNDPPTPFVGMVYFSGRIWGFTGNKVWFSGLEEINQGVPEESFPSGLAGNFWAFDEPVTGLAVAGGVNNQILAIFCGGRLYGITGNTLDTFRRFNISQRRGCRNRTTITMLGGMVSWLDSSNQVWASDGNSLQEMSQDIRPDLVGINPAICSATFHISGRFHWYVLSINGKSNFIPASASADRASSGTVAWSSIGNIFVADNIYASVTLTSQVSHLLQAQPNPFVFASGATITGIQVDIKGFQTNTTGNQTLTAQLTKGLLNPVGSTRSFSMPASNGFVTVGGPTDLWGTTWSATDVGGGAGFSVDIQATEAGGVATTFNVDYVQITLYFDAKGDRSYVYDMDLNQWMPPWSFAANYIYSGEISAGNYVLLGPTDINLLQMNATAFNDNGTTYQPIGALGLLAVVPDYGKRFSYGALGVYDEPTRTGVPWIYQVTNNAQTLSNFQFLADDDPVKGTYTSIVANLQTPATVFKRNQGTFVTQNIYTTTSPVARWIAPKFTLANADQIDNVYELFMAYKGEGGL
jgi:hypothetical protein